MVLYPSSLVEYDVGISAHILGGRLCSPTARAKRKGLCMLIGLRRSSWVTWIKFVDPCSGGTPTLLEEDGADESLLKSVAGLKKLKAVGWSKL